MTELVYTTKDKSDWGDGPWQDEPDKVQWKDSETGLACLAVRNHGAWCGYVGVPSEHPLYKEHYSDHYFDVHGGLTFSESCSHGSEEDSICHVPAPGEPDDVWWFGFDCAHSGDIDPLREALNRERYEETKNPIWLPIDGPWKEEYRTLDYVKSEVTSLAKQLHNVTVVVGLA